jgi:NuA3 HAT complex component NTO1
VKNIFLIWISELCVHQSCYGVEIVPEGEWYCEPCAESANGVHCCVCPNEEDGAFKKTTEGSWIHLNCALWIPETVFGGEPLGSPVQDVACIDPGRFDLVSDFIFYSVFIMH